MEVKTVMKYNRESACWLCPDCDVENELSLYQCRVCGFAKNDRVITLSPGESIAEYKEIETVVKDAFSTLGGTVSSREIESAYTDWEYKEEEKSSGVGRAIAWIFIVAVVLLIIGVLYYNS